MHSWSNLFTHLSILIGPLKAWGVPASLHKATTHWSKYPGAVISYRNKADLVLVDGRFRIASALETIKNADFFGYLLIHDFFNRPFYHSIVLKYFKIVDCADMLVVLKKRENVAFDYRFQDDLRKSKTDFERLLIAVGL